MTEEFRTQCRELMARYPQARSALLPMLHLAQAEDGYVTPEAIRVCAELLELSTAEVAAVASFYTMYKRHRSGTYHLGVCTNTLCAVLGGDEIWRTLSERLDTGHDEVSADGTFSLERIECQAACTHAPVMTANWEYLDDMDVDKALDVVARLGRGEAVRSTRGPVIRPFTDTERTLAGYDDGLAGEGGTADAKMLAGVAYARQHGMSAPQAPERSPFDETDEAGGAAGDGEG